MDGIWLSYWGRLEDHHTTRTGLMTANKIYILLRILRKVVRTLLSEHLSRQDFQSPKLIKDNR